MRLIALPRHRANVLLVVSIRRLAQPLRRWLRLACVWGVLSTIAAPAALGAAMGPVLRELGMGTEHMCMCHMPAGKCGCPECARLEAERLRERPVAAVPTWKSGCDDDAPATPFSALPAAVLPSCETVLAAPVGDRVSRLWWSAPPPALDREPATPPPRRA